MDNTINNDNINGINNINNNINYNNNSMMYGVVDGIYFNHFERDNELNKRISVRNVPSANLQPQFSLRPTSSKYEMMPIFDRRPKAIVPIRQEANFNPELIFNPGNATAPWSCFSNNVDLESTLRNLFFALQKNDQVEYVPSKNSDLYNTHVIGTNEQQPFPGLFQESNLADFNPNIHNVGNDFFHNNTRVQHRNLDLNTANTKNTTNTDDHEKNIENQKK